MKVTKHPNYYEALLLLGAKVVVPFRMRAGDKVAKGRFWKVSAVLRYNGYIISLYSSYFGNLVETEEVAKANMNIVSVAMGVEGGREEDIVTFKREGYGLIFLIDGIYGNPDMSREVGMEIRSICDYDTSKYIGIPSDEDVERIANIGYKKLIGWK